MLDHVRKVYTDSYEAIADATFDVADSELLAGRPVGLREVDAAA